MCQRAGFRSALTVLPLLGRIAAALPFAISIASNAQVTAVATTTQLSVAVPAVAVGVPALHMARVTDSSSHPVPLGTVTFYDGSRSLGSAQIVSHPGGRFTQGTASVKAASLILGANSITAVFAGTTADLASASAINTVTFTGKSQTAMTLSAALVRGQYTLTAALLRTGTGLVTGNVDFLDTTTGTSSGTVALSGTAWNDGFPATQIHAGTTRTVAASVPAVGDFNGDGFLDIATALSGGGSGLGFSDFLRSVAIKFDLFNNTGEGPDSTGLYVNGARPTLPAIDLSGTGIHSGDLFKAHKAYDGTNLTMTLTDTVTLAKWSHSWPH